MMQIEQLGSTVTLYDTVQTGVDGFNNPIYEEVEVEVEHVLIQPADDDAVASDMDLYGKRCSYILHIPEGDTHDWKDKIVKLPTPWNLKVRVYGEGKIYAMSPFIWNKQVKAENYG